MFLHPTSQALKVQEAGDSVIVWDLTLSAEGFNKLPALQQFEGKDF